MADVAGRDIGSYVDQVQPPIEQIPIFVKSGAILPLAESTLHTGDPGSWRLTVNVYGENPAPASVYEDDGAWAPALTELALAWDPARRSGTATRAGNAAGPRYEVVAWKQIL